MILSSTSIGGEFHVLAEDSSGIRATTSQVEEFANNHDGRPEAWISSWSDQLVSRRRRAVFLCGSWSIRPNVIECATQH